LVSRKNQGQGIPSIFDILLFDIRYSIPLPLHPNDLTMLKTVISLLAAWSACATLFSQSFSNIPGPLGIVHELIRDNSGNLYAGTHTKGVYKSADNGQSWTGLGGNTIMVGRINALAFDQSGQLLAATEQGGVRRWNGSAWTAINTGLSTACGLVVPVRAIATDTAGFYYAGAHSYPYCFTSGGLFRYDGANWIAFQNGLDNTEINALATHPLTRALYAGTEGGVFVLNGNNWSALNPGLPNMNVHCLRFAPNGDLYAGTDAGFTRLPNGGNSWTALPNPLSADPVLSIAVNPALPAQLIIGSGHSAEQVGSLIGHLFQSSDAGANWTAIGNNLNTTAVNALVFNENNVIGGGWGFFRSTDSGLNWVPSNTGYSGRAFNTSGSLAISRAPEKVLFYGSDEGLFRSVDQGQSWEPANKGITRRNISLLKTDCAGNIFCGANRYLGGSSGGIGDGELYKSSDLGQNWTPVAISKDWTYTEIAELSNGDLICAHGFGAQLPSATIVGSSLSLSQDQGEHWADLPIITGKAFCCTVNAAGDFFTAGESTGVYRSTDKGQNWELSVLTGTNSNVSILETSPNGDILVSSGGVRTLQFSNAAENGFPFTPFSSTVLPDYIGVSDVIFDHNGKAYCATRGNNIPTLFTIEPPFSANSTFNPVAGLAGTLFRMNWDDEGYLYAYSPGFILKSNTPLNAISACSPSATEEVDKASEQAVYPNPFDSQLTILPQFAGKSSLFRMFDLLGRPVYEVSLQSETRYIDTNQVPKGLYFWEISMSGKRVKSGKLIKGVDTF
jgi:photosystem II stability/assembly factor-like uncharacterized protein